MDAKMFEYLIQGGSFAVLAFICLWIFIKQIPRNEERGAVRDKLFADTIERSQNTFLSSLDKQHQEHREEQKMIQDRADSHVVRLENAIRDLGRKG